MAEDKTKETSGFEEIKRRERIRRLANLMLGKKETSKNPPEIYREELEKNVEAIIEQEAIALYKKLTGKRKIPEEGVPQSYKDRAMMEVLRRWQKTLKEIRTTVPKAVVPPEAKYFVDAIPICPKCGELMKLLVGKLYQCPKCYSTIRLG